MNLSFLMSFFLFLITSCGTLGTETREEGIMNIEDDIISWGRHM